MNKNLLGKYTTKALNAMDIVVKHAKRNKKIYQYLVCFIALGYAVEVFDFIYSQINYASVQEFGRNVSQMSTSEISMLFGKIGSALTGAISELCRWAIIIMCNIEILKKVLNRNDKCME